jgi:transcription elongation factor GreA
MMVVFNINRIYYTLFYEIKIAMHKIPMTQSGAKKLKDELTHLKTVERPGIIQRISEARAHGDLKENAEYHAAKERQSFVEGRIREVEHKLSHAQIIDTSKMTGNGKVTFGATVKIINTDSDQEISYQIVGEDEADIKAGKISVHSPIARALISKSIQDVVTVQTPAGPVEYEILAVEYSESD